jgi:hypothetical protein
MDAPILISPHWDIEFHVHTDKFNLVVEAMLVQNLTRKYDQLITYALQLFNNIERNYTTKREALAMVYALHKLCHYLLGNKFIFYVDHMALLYLVQKPQVFGRITRWLLLFLKYDFSIIYKLGKSYFVVDSLSWMLNLTKENGVSDQTMDYTFFLLQLTWPQEFSKYLIIEKIPIQYNQKQKKI